ncbi:MAG: aminotransferase class V-fold PLP-dependent enzyme [Candidatus Nanohaloarchaea archaeon]
MKPEKLREDFPIFREREDLVYLDNAATSQKPRQVIDAVKEFYEKNNANVGRGLYDLAGSATESYRSARRTVADFVGASTDEVVFVRNTTEAENLVAESLEFEGDVVVSEMAHHSEQLPWRRKANKEGRETRYIESEAGKLSVESAREQIDGDTGLVAISHVSNVFGAENPVEDIIELAHENDAIVVLDAAQSVPHMPVDVKELGVDFMAFSGHKMLGPAGTGILYGRKELLQQMQPYQVGGGMISKVAKSEVSYERPPGRFEAGTENVAGAVGLAAAIDYLEEVGMHEIESHDRELTGKAIKALRELEGVNVLSPEDAMVASFNIEELHPHDVAEVLNSEGVAVRAGHHCAQPLMEQLDVTGAVRASPYLYNTEEDVEKLVAAVEKAQEVFRDVQG